MALNKNMFYDYLDVDILIRTIYGEARGESRKGKIAVAFIPCTRAKIAAEYKKIHKKNHPLYGSGTVASACTMAYQFSCWNLNDSNLPIINALNLESIEAQPSIEACHIALEELEVDPSCGATHYHTINMIPFPNWAEGQKSCAKVGMHIFYNLG